MVQICSQENIVTSHKTADIPALFDPWKIIDIFSPFVNPYLGFLFQPSK